MTKIVGRDPVFVAESAVTVLLAVSLFFNFSTDVQALVNAAIVAVGGVFAAWMVAAEKAVPLLSGAARAVIALMLGLGIDIAPNIQAGIMAVLAAVVAFLMRGQVVAPVPLQVPAHAVVPVRTRDAGGHV